MLEGRVRDIHFDGLLIQGFHRQASFLDSFYGQIEIITAAYADKKLLVQRQRERALEK
jgi:hypothetical protein